MWVVKGVREGSRSKTIKEESERSHREKENQWRDTDKEGIRGRHKA